MMTSLTYNDFHHAQWDIFELWLDTISDDFDYGRQRLLWDLLSQWRLNAT